MAGKPAEYQVCRQGIAGECIDRLCGMGARIEGGHLAGERALYHYAPALPAVPSHGIFEQVQALLAREQLRAARVRQLESLLEACSGG